MEKTLKALAEKTVALLKERDLKIATAESCTGGMLSSLITDVSGASQIFSLGICAYSCEIKNEILGVSGKTLSKYGAVSEATAQEMAENIRLKAAADIGVSVTGVAGPSTSEGKPVGLVFIALSSKDHTIVKELNIKPQGRDFVKKSALVELLNLVCIFLQNGV